MKKILFAIMCLFISTGIVLAKSNIFQKKYDTETDSFGKTNYNALYKMDNIALKDTVVTVTFTHENELDDSNCNKDYCLVLKQYDKKGKLINSLYLQDVINYIAPVEIDDYLYVVVTYGDREIGCNYYDNIGVHDCTSNFDSYIEKYDKNLNKIASLQIDEDYDAWSFNLTNKMNSMFIGPYCKGLPSYLAHSFIDGMNCEFVSSTDGRERYYSEDYYLETVYEYFDFYQIHKENDNIVIWTIEEDIVVDNNLTSYTTRENSWKAKYGDGSDYSFNLSDKDAILTSGTITEGDKYIAFLKENDKEIYLTDEYSTFVFPIKVNDYYIVLGLADKLESDILIIKDGEIVQKISGNYWNLRKINNGFVVKNLGIGVPYYFGNVSESQNVLSEVYYTFIVNTKTDGNGEITFERKTNGDEDIIEFEVKPNEGYVLGEIKVTDSEGNTIIFTDYKFIMPSADVLIEATFVPKNPNTDTFFTVIAVIMVIAAFALILGVNKKKQLE